MILPTMTLTELAKEIQSDYKEVHARWTKFNPKFNKMRLKQTYYPWIWNTEIITKKNNKWFFSFYAQSKKDANVVIPHAYITFRYGGHRSHAAEDHDVPAHRLHRPVPELPLRSGGVLAGQQHPVHCPAVADGPQKQAAGPVGSRPMTA